MGTLDRITSAFSGIASAIGDFVEFFDFDLFEQAEGVARSDEPTTLAVTLIETIQPLDEAGALLADLGEEFILLPIQQEGQLNPDNVEGVLDEVEGNALALLGAGIAQAGAIEGLTAGQVDELPSEITQAILGLGIDDVTGREIDARLQEGIDPALKQKVHREARSKQADFADYTEANLRAKWAGGNIPTRTDEIPQEVIDLHSPQDFGWLGDPDTYGTIPEQQALYEYDALAHLEPEELFEELPQKGVIPSRAATEQILHTAGLPEDIKEGYLELWRNLPKSQDLVQEGIRLEEPIRVIDEAVFENRLTPEQAVAIIRSDVDAYITVSGADGTPQTLERDANETVEVVIGELRARWQIIASVPNDAPTRGQLERWWRNGVISTTEFANLNDRFGVLPEFFLPMLRDNAVRQGPDDIREAWLFNRIGDGEAILRLQLAGLDEQQANEFLNSAEDFNDFTEDLLLQRTDATREGGTAAAPVQRIPGIGEAFGFALETAGISTVGQLAEATVEDVVSAVGVSDERAQEWISLARNAVQSGS